MTGVSSDLLAPDAVFTWAQAVQSTYALEGCPTLSSSVKFADAAPADWVCLRSKLCGGKWRGL